ncbi:MAG: thiamine phosphate synthase [Sedimentisphaerales bacterium]|nr:thiamine phosphate synthase [Sedimentisphaerales bacterium]
MIRGYYFITDSGLSKAGNLSDVEQALKANVSVIQYRNKTSDTREFFEEAIALRKICKNATFLINDRIDIALACNADGVHLGQSDMPYKTAREILGPNKIIGLTVHSIEDALAAQEMGADYIGAAPIFATTTKSDAGTPLGVEGLKEICQKVELPVVAIGGIDLSNAQSVINAGADSICAISAVITKENVCAEAKKFQVLFM